ncbi:MAG: hypothetical protein Q9201_000928 [Fulgogasparrea decipioides]
MAESQAPRVNLPAVTPPRVTPTGPNSWVANQGQAFSKTSTVTNRDKYKNKPMPPTPEPSPSPVPNPLTTRKNRAYIQPATPLVSPGPVNLNIKNRAATDPVMPQPLFTSTTCTVNQLRNKYSQPKSKGRYTKDEEDATHRPTSPTLLVSHKASQILGVYPVEDNHRETPPASAPPSSHTPGPFRTSTENTKGRNVSPNRQVHSTPVPTRRYLRENNLLASASTRASQELKAASSMSTEEKKQPHLPKGIVTDHNSLNPTRLVTSDRKGEVEYVRQNEMQRVLSFSGVIEQSDSPRGAESAMELNSARTDWNANILRPEYSGELLHPTIYSPSNYGGVWENDPKVGRTLPPFSPFHLPQPPPPHSDADQRAFSQTSGEVPMILQRFPGESSHGSGYTHSLRSQNSWAPSGIGNSFNQPNAPSSAAEATPRFSTHMRNNSVPPPPTSYPGFQPSGPLPPGLVQMELNLHHHVESCFGSLMRLSTDNTDRAVDKIVRRMDELQETVEKGFKSLKNEVKDVRKEMCSLRKELAVAPKASESLNESVNSLNKKLDQLDGKVGEIESHFQRAAVEASESEREASLANSQGQNSPHRRPEGVRTSASTRSEQRQPYTSGTTHVSNSTQYSINGSSRGRRSTTTSEGAARRSGERSVTRKELFAQIGAVSVPVPDIRDHPAYRGVVEGYGQSSSIYQVPNYSETWYQQAYGEH